MAFGAIRAVRATSRFAFGVEALGSYLQKSTKLGGECVDIVVSFGGLTFTQDPGYIVTTTEFLSLASSS